MNEIQGFLIIILLSAIIFFISFIGGKGLRQLEEINQKLEYLIEGE